MLLELIIMMVLSWLSLIILNFFRLRYSIFSQKFSPINWVRYCLLLKCFKLNPLYWPLWTNWWQLWHSGTCLRLILARFWSKVFSFTLIVLMCFRWCISTFNWELQLAQDESNGLLDLICHLIAFVGSVVDSLAMNCIGDHFRSGFAKLMIFIPFFDE